MTKLKTVNYQCALTVLFAALVFCFWYFCYPQALCYQEQNQLFLFTADYLQRDLSVAGGLADYLGEFIVQFYYVPWAGALWLAMLFAAMQGTACFVMKTYTSTGKLTWLGYAGSFLLPLFIIWVMGDIDVLLSFPIAITLSLLAADCVNKANCRCGRTLLIAELFIIPVLYWTTGGEATWLYVVLRLAFSVRNKKQMIWNAALVVYFLAVELTAYQTLLRQYPLKSVMLGINYYRIPEQLPGISGGYDSDLYALLKLNEQVRHGKWNDIIRDAEKHQVKDAYASNSVNLALAKTRQLADRMFTFYQSGEDALLSPHKNNNMTNYPTMEAFWHLGMINSSLRYASDLQESILNGRKSGRLTQRMAQCYIVNGSDKAAHKMLDILKNTLFYRQWALETEKKVGNKTLISQDPEMGQAQRMRFKNDFLYNYEEKEKMLGLLFVNNPDNKMALDYFMGQLLLNGNIKDFMQYMGWVQNFGGYTAMPTGYQDAVRCIQSHGNAPGSAYGEYVKKMMNQQKEGGDQ